MGVEEELLVVDETGCPMPLGPEALEVAARRGRRGRRGRAARRPRPALADIGDEDRVAHGVAEILRHGTGADLQRRVHAETGDLAAVVRAAVAVTHGEVEDAEGRAGRR